MIHTKIYMSWSPQPDPMGMPKNNEFLMIFDIPESPPPPHLPLERFAVLILKSSAGRQNSYISELTDLNFDSENNEPRELGNLPKDRIT